jgi:ArsR family transcriptional regulator
MAPTIAIDCVDFCKALADETRQAILRLLLQGEMCVSDIVEAFGLSQPTISHHLGILKNVGLVSSRKEGKQVYYATNQENVIECCGMLMAKFSEEEDDAEVNPIVIQVGQVEGTT